MLTRPSGGDLTIFWGDQAIKARPGESVATALLAAGITTTRTTAVSGAPRGPYCMMGACFDCVAEVDGRGNVQTCMTPVRDGMRVRMQDGARGLVTGSQDT